MSKGKLMGTTEKTLTAKESLDLGAKLLDILVVSTGAFEHKVITNGEKKNRTLRATPETNKILNESPELFAFLNPMYPIMICPPKPWTGLKEGGYWLGGKLQAPFTKQLTHVLRGCAEDYTAEKIPRVYEAVNTIQETPWKINKKVLNVINSIWHEFGGGIAGIPLKFAEEIPPKPWGKLTDKEFKAYKLEHPAQVKQWAKKANEVYNNNHKNTLQRAVIRRKLDIAEKVQDEGSLYFPHYVDFRGRVYPLPAFVNPQGDDSGKALIHFKEGKPLGSQEGVNWLAIHGAGLAGKDKVSFKERIKWVKDNEHHIMQSAKHPLDYLWWTKQDDKSFQLLAFCFEWTEYLEKGMVVGDFKSHLPIALDGTCNGLQHLSAMLLDNTGGGAVNLTKAEVPSDIYTVVLEKTKELIRADLATTTDERRQLMGEAWLVEGNLIRETVKRPVMTTPYGVKAYGVRDQLRKFSKECFGGGEDGTPLYAIKHFEFTKYLSEHLIQAIHVVIISANIAMDYLMEIAKTFCNETENVVSWKVPLTDFKVHQGYYKPNSKRVDIYQGSQRIQLTVNRDNLNQVNKQKQVSGISPNFIHSLDAAMLMQTVLKTKGTKIGSLALIHDSYATHACDTALLSRLLRESFIDLYTSSGGNVLDNLRRQLQDQLTEKALKALEPSKAVQLPMIPSRGHLNIYETMDSPYFFS